MGAVGFVDDYIKIFMQRSLGLRSKAKMIGQTVVALVSACWRSRPGLADADGITPAVDQLSFIRDYGPTSWRCRIPLAR